MRPGRAGCEEQQLPRAARSRPAAVVSSIEQIHPDDSPSSKQTPICSKGRKKVISGRVVALLDSDEEHAVTGANVEVYQVCPLRTIAAGLPSEVLENIRAFVLGRFKPLDVYSHCGHVADDPVVSFVDIQRLRDVPGFELIETAAASSSDSAFEQHLRNNLAVFRSLLFYYHSNSLPAVRVHTTTTNALGRFYCEVVEQDDIREQPGYYFKVRRFISANLFITLYNPMPAAWFTHWDVAGDRTVTLRTRHPLAVEGRV